MYKYLVALILTASSAIAQSSSGSVIIPGIRANPDVLYDCLSKGRAARTCLGAMTVDCQAENELGNENLEERLCSVEELNAWRGLLKQEQAYLRDRLSNLPKNHVDYIGNPAALSTNADRLWKNWHELQCQAERAAVGASNRRAIVEDQCLRDLTAMQFGQLRAVRNRLGSK